MGGSFAPGIPNRLTSSSLYGNQGPQQPQGIAGGRRTMPGGPLLPRLPHNPYAIAARKIGKLSTPYQPKNSNDMF
jgi:hypothetical protein